jgi:ankyrin repeat protein
MDSKFTKLWHAVRTLNIQEVRSVLQEGVSINVVNRHGENLLYEAMATNNPKIIKLLIDVGIDVNRICDGEDLTPLEWAAHMGRLNMAKMLIENGAATNSMIGHWSPLKAAINSQISKYKLEMVKLLVENGADIFECDADDKTMLMYAAEQYNSNVLHFLIEKGLDPQAVDKRGYTAVHYAKLIKMEDNVSILKHIKIGKTKSSKASASGEQGHVGQESISNSLKLKLVDRIIQMVHEKHT